VSCVSSSSALPGLLCVSACEGEAGQHHGGARDGRPKVRSLPPSLWSCASRGGWVSAASVHQGAMLTRGTVLMTIALYLSLPCREYVVDLEEGSQHLMRYRTIAPLVSTGAVQLI